MEIVVKIPDDMIKSIEQGSFGAKYNIYDLVGCLMNGTPLPKGHGRLIDAKEVYRKFYSRCLAKVAKEILSETDTIIEADKVGSEDKEC